MVDEKLLTVLISCKASDTVVDGDDIGIKAVDKKIQRIERGDGTAC